MSNRDNMPKPKAPAVTQEPEMPKPEAPKEPKVETLNLPIAPKVEEPEMAAPVQGLEVVALRAGFYGSHRKVEGDKFLIKSEDEMGTWMKCSNEKVQEAFDVKIAELKKTRAVR